MTEKKFKIIRPEQHDLERYKQARELIVDTYSGLNGLHSIYEFGKINNPGISDLDLMFVFEDQPTSYELGMRFEAMDLPGWIESLLCGSTLMVFNKTDFQRVLLWDDLVLNRLYGKELSLIEVENKNHRSIAQIMDWLPERLLSLSRFSKQKEIPIIRYLGLMHSLNYTFKRLIDLGILGSKDADPYTTHFDRVSSIRENYYSLTDNEVKDILLYLMHNSLQLGEVAIEKAYKWLSEEKNYYHDSDGENGLFLLSKEHGFIIDSDKERREQKLNQNKNLSLIGVPNIWGVHWSFYANGDSFIQRNMQSSLSNFGKIEGDIKPNFKFFLQKRINHCISMATFLKNNSFSKGLFKMGWFYR